MYRFLAYAVCFSVTVFVLVNCSTSKKTTGYPSDNKTLTQGKELFNNNCASCHAIADEGIGPRLGGITHLLSEKSLTDFILNPAKVIDSGDLRAVNLSKKFKMVMPSFDFLKPAEINSILAYIHKETALNPIEPLVVKTETDAVSTTSERVGVPVKKSGITIELEDFVQIPASSDKPPLTRIANMRPHPTADGSLFVSDQRGIIHHIHKGQVSTFLDIRQKIDHYINAPGLGTGLGSFAFHPDYQKNGLIYITHTEAFTGKKADYEFNDSIKVAMQWVVSAWKINDVKSAVFEGSRRELLRINVPSGVHGTQDINFIPGIDKKDPDYGMLFIGTGDGGSTIGKHPELTHHLNSLLGTIIRIDPLGNNSPNGKYGIPSDNPFVNNPDPGTRKEIWAFGFRNPHRMSWDLNHGKIMFSAEVGEGNFEEVNVIVKGGDYGWNTREGSYGISPSDLKTVFKVSDSEKYIRPYLEYDHLDGNAISGGSVYEGALTALKDKYIFGDIVNGRIFFANINRQLSDSTVYEIGIIQNGEPTNLQKMSGSKRVDLRVEYDYFTREMYMMTKSDGKIRRISKAR
ncbi:PQQ-dependent sugar dehydrogenase [Dyadobacter sp. LHD-138]|uniref:PQQ-dependent sugar dehydrogenase n=1 Tax=Dyadobacter sp. LHD-138 TaxID=3071413 RepID=UPI0027DEB446|nr:PQQ-dependent sugar dehydrogenase [Dyadobacter sp. LHD-138]MDQ6479878.1 PQQ-dependent sugar dehydrogenase [Dyadobacter sp. LHD-138]